MRVYIAGYWRWGSDIEKVPEAKYLLVSYVENEGGNIAQRHKLHNLQDRIIFLDSGAFSAMTRKSIIDIDKYADYIKENKKELEVYANLDVIGNPEASKKNQLYLEKQGLNPIPTFHFNSDIKYLKEILKKYDYFALGGLVPILKQKKTAEQWLDYCWSVISKTKPLPKVHGFGLSTYWAWQRYPFYSCDGTSWLQPGRYGRVTKMVDGRIINMGKEQNNVLGHMLGKEKGGYHSIQLQQIKEYLKMGEQITKLWEHRGIKWDK